MSDFKSLMRRADHARRATSDPIRHAWYTGYMRGLRRAHHGDAFGTDAEHQLFLAAANDHAPDRAALGNGYAAGLKLEWAEPPAGTIFCSLCRAAVTPINNDGDMVCPWHTGYVLP